jgi:hypothetical protein
MLINGCDCLIVGKTQYREMGVPYSEETIREAVSLLTEEAPIEADGCCRAIKVHQYPVRLNHNPPDPVLPSFQFLVRVQVIIPGRRVGPPP